MNIISSKKEKNRIIDGIHTILSLSEKEYRIFIEKMKPRIENIEELFFYYPTDECEAPTNDIQIGLEKIYNDKNRYIGRAYYGHTDITMYEIIKECQNLLKDYSIDSIEYFRINEIIHTRDLGSFKTFYSNKNKVKPMIMDKIFQMLSNDELLSKFMDYNNNTKLFAIDNQIIPKSEYLKILGEIFGSKDANGNLNNNNNISTDFYIPNLQEMKERYSQIYDQINMERYVNSRYTFSTTLPSKSVIRDKEEPDWKISQEIYKEIFKDMPKGLSLEEQAMYIYCKMCVMFSYDEGYIYRDKLKKINYESTFSKEHLEGLKPGDKITCYDFSRIYVKLINELDGDITAVMILEGMNEGHALAGFYTENVSVTVEPINISSSNQDATNDLMKAKNGIKLRGVGIISDKDDIIEKAINKVYTYILGKPPKTIKEYIHELKSIQNEEVQNDILLKLQTLIETMKSNNIHGNEFAQTLWGICRTKYFGDDKLERAYLGKLQEEENGSNRFKRYVLLRTQKNKEDINSSRRIFLIDTDTLDLKEYTEEEIIAKLNSGELIYENEKHKLAGIDKEVDE